MKRDRTTFLIEWLNSSSRKPLVIRGARQVGKTWLVRDLAKSQNRRLFELNFEKQPKLESLFSSNDPREIITNIEASTSAKIEPGKTILFLDEVQIAPHLLAKLRWFNEEMPELPVIAAGSLLDFPLAKHEFSMPVGRIGYIYLEPLSFEEFLEALGHYELRKYLREYNWNSKIPESIHSQLSNFLKEFLVVGGMPEAVSAWVKEKDPIKVNQIHLDLLATYRDDFAKYSGRIEIERLDEVMNSIPRQLGQKFVYKHANFEINTPPLKQALELLSKARVCHRVVSTAANGLPLGAETNEKFFKVIMLDCGLCSASLGLSLHQLRSLSEISMINSGGMAEQLTGQLLRTIIPSYTPPNLYYWRREEKGAQAEIDFVIAHENQVIPIEVKAGKSGSLKSLHQFMKEKNKQIAVRFNSDIPSITPVSIKLLEKTAAEYQLLSLPFYLIGQLHRLINLSF
jgi:predicted AAA+ superfamily ATPase